MTKRDIIEEPDPVAPRELLWLCLILAIAAVLRIVGLDAPLWYDEIWTIDTHISLPWGAMLSDYSMNHHYLFSLESKLATEVFGEQIWAYRLPAMLFGLGTVAAVWWLGREVAGPAVGLLSALLVALSYHQVWFSQNARGYTELAFWSTLGLILFLRGLQTPTRAIWIGFGLTAAAAVFTHLTGAFFFVALGLLWLLSLLTGFGRGPVTRRDIVLPLVGTAIAAVLVLALYLPVLPSLLDTVSDVPALSAIDPMQEYQNPLWTVLEGIRTAIGSAGPVAVFVAVAAALVIALGAVGAHRRAPLFFPAVAMHIAVTLAILLFLDMRIWPRFFFVDIGLILILIVIGCRTGADLFAWMFRRPAVGTALFALAAVVMVGLSVVLVLRNYAAPKQDLAAAYALVEETRSEGEAVYAIGPAAVLYQRHFGVDWGIIQSPEDYAAAMAGDGPVALVVAFPDRSFRSIPALGSDTGQTLDLVRRFPGTLGDGDVLVYRRN